MTTNNDNGKAVDEVKPEQLPTTPGIGVSGLVMCPFGFQRGACLKQGCELFVELSYGPNKVGRCSFSWSTIILTELRLEIEKVRATIAPLLSPEFGPPGGKGRIL